MRFSVSDSTNKMGQCFTGCCRKHRGSDQNVLKQDKNIDDKRMLKAGIEVLKKDFSVQIGYNRRTLKTYGSEPVRVSQGVPSGTQSEDPQALSRTLS